MRYISISCSSVPLASGHSSQQVEKDRHLLAAGIHGDAGG
jgi:hypothetical protein